MGSRRGTGRLSSSGTRCQDTSGRCGNRCRTGSGGKTSGVDRTRTSPLRVGFSVRSFVWTVHREGVTSGRTGSARGWGGDNGGSSCMRGRGRSGRRGPLPSTDSRRYTTSDQRGSYRDVDPCPVVSHPGRVSLLRRPRCVLQLREPSGQRVHLPHGPPPRA